MSDPILQMNNIILDISMAQSTYGSSLNYEVQKLYENYNNDVIYMGKIHSIIGDISNNLLNQVERDLNHKKRQQDIQEYYNRQYQQQIFLLKLFIMFSLLALLGCLLFNYSLISVYLLTFYLGLVLSVAFVVIFYYLWDFFLRDNTVFDEYNFATYMPTKMGQIKHNSNDINLELDDNIIYC